MKIQLKSQILQPLTAVAVAQPPKKFSVQNKQQKTTSFKGF